MEPALSAPESSVAASASELPASTSATAVAESEMRRTRPQVWIMPPKRRPYSPS
jgi:hypothetical protein